MVRPIRSLSLTIPVDSVTHLIDHLQNLVDTKSYQMEKSIDFNRKRATVKTKCVHTFTLKRWMEQFGVLWATLIHRSLK